MSLLTIAEGGMPSWMMKLLETAMYSIVVVSASVLVWGVAYGLVQLLRIESRRLRGMSCEAEMVMLRKQVGFYLLFALELLIAADIIETMVQPSLEHLAILGGVVAVRIIVGFALAKELKHLDADATEEEPPCGGDVDPDRSSDP